MRIKNFVKGFYTTDFSKDPEALKDYLHPEVELFWNNSGGFNKMDYNQIGEMIEKFSNSFLSIRAEISHLLKDNNRVVVRYTYMVRTYENPEEELPITHFISIWEIKDDLLFKGHQISQPADDSPENLNSFFG